jgi:hypothetical protein
MIEHHLHRHAHAARPRDVKFDFVVDYRQAAELYRQSCRKESPALMLAAA